MEFIVHGVYRPPKSNVKSFLEALEDLLTCNNPTIIAGDLNINCLKKDNLTNQFLDVLSSTGASFTNHAITRHQTKTLIDYVIINNLPNNLFLETYTSSSLLSSDHSMLVSLLNVSPPKRKENLIIRKICDYNKLKCEFDYDDKIINELTASDSCTYLINCIQKAMQNSCTAVNFKSKSDINPQWADTKYHRLTNTSVNLLKKIEKLEKRGKPTSKLRSKLNNIKRSIDDHSNRISILYYSNLINTDNRNSWSVINSILGKQKEAKNIAIEQNGSVIYNPVDIAEIFNQKFSSISSNHSNNLTLNIEDNIYNGQVVNDCIYLDVVSPEEMFSIMSDLNSKKAAGSDEIPCRIIKELKSELADPLSHILNKIFMEAEYPNILKLATVVPIHKKGDPLDPSNYRPISLLPIVNKIFEKAILNRILNFMDTNNVNDIEQYAYKKTLGTTDAILKFSHDISNYLDAGDYCVAIFMDLSSAFDTLDRKVLLSKLSHLGIKGHALKLLTSYFENRRQAVRIDGVLSTEVVMNDGVAQGSLVGPPFFNISQFDSPKISSNRIKYADDNVIYKNCKKENLNSTIMDMIYDVKLMAKHFNHSGLKLNFTKTNFVIFRNNDLVDIPNDILIDDNTKISRMPCQMFLGVMLDEHFNLKEQFARLIEKLTQSYRALSIIKHHLPTKLRLDYFQAHIMSHLQYCPFIYAKLNQNEIDRLQTIQNRSIKAIYNLNIRHPTVDLFKSYAVNTLPVIGIIYSSMIINIKKSILLKSDELLKYEVLDNNRRSSGELRPARFRRKQQIGRDISYLGVILYNQLPSDLKNMQNLTKFKKDLKLYLMDKIDLLLDENQLKTRRIS